MRPLPRSIHAERLGSFSSFVFSVAGAVARRGQWPAFVHERTGGTFDGRLVLDVGCFDASFLIEIAQRNPRSAFVGLDWKCKPLCDGAENISQLDLKNVSLVRARGSDIAQIFAAGELDEVWVFHPEVCAAEETKNRLLDLRFLDDVHATLRDEKSIFAFKTDHRDYYEWMLARCENDFCISIQSTDFWNDPAALAHTKLRLFSSETTKYERRFVKKRRPIYYVEMRKKGASTMTATAMSTSASVPASAEGMATSATEGMASATERMASATE